MMRLFVALELPSDLRIRLARLKRPLPRARWVNAENLHLSLRFVGEVNDEQAADIDTALARIDMPAFELTIAGVGEFDDKPGTGIAFQIDVEDAVGVNMQIRKLTEVVEEKL